MKTKAYTFLLFMMPFWIQVSVAQPNIVFLLVDDLGYTDLGCYGSTFYETPHIDRLAGQGMLFTQSYAAASICSPTRSSIMTGKYPVRTGITDWIPGKKVKNTKLIQPQTALSLSADEITFAEILQNNGYATFYAGKWHLGNEKSSDSSPLTQGFDLYYSGAEIRKAKSPFTTDSLTAHTLAFIQQQVKAQKPFIVCLSYYDVHDPMYDYPDYIEHYKNKAAAMSASPDPIPEHDGVTRPRQDNPQFASLVGAVDESVGKINRLLADLGIEENTIVIFTSDNGGLSTKNNVGPTSNIPLRAGKGWLYEGGIRVPLIVKAPAFTKAGSRCATPTISTDFYPTFLAWAGLPLQPELHQDGLSLLPLLQQKAALNRDDLYWHYPHYHGSTWTPGAAIRSGDWKLIAFDETQTYELYNLKSDPGEQYNRAAERPEMVQRLKSKLEKWQKETGAKMPQQLGD